jgi:hypothetical protein
MRSLPGHLAVMFNNLNKYWRSVSFESLHDGVGIGDASTFHERFFIERNAFDPRHANGFPNATPNSNFVGVSDHTSMNAALKVTTWTV